MALQLTINGEPRTVSETLSVADLVRQLGYDARRIAVEINREVVPLAQHPDHHLTSGDAVEIVRLVGGGAPEPAVPTDKPLVVGTFTFRSRLITGTGKYASYELMRDFLAASGCEGTTMAVLRERLVGKQGRNILGYLDQTRHTILPSTARLFRRETPSLHPR